MGKFDEFFVDWTNLRHLTQNEQALFSRESRFSAFRYFLDRGFSLASIQSISFSFRA